MLNNLTISANTGENLQRWRTFARLTQIEAAARLRVSQSTYCRAEAGERMSKKMEAAWQRLCHREALCVAQLESPALRAAEAPLDASTTIKWDKGRGYGPGDLVMYIREQAPHLLAELCRLGLEAAKDRDRIAAIALALAYGYGRPQEKLTVEHVGDESGTLAAAKLDIERLKPDERLKLYKLLEKASAPALDMPAPHVMQSAVDAQQVVHTAVDAQQPPEPEPEPGPGPE